MGARGYKPTWTRRTTRIAGLAVALALGAAALGPVAAAEPPWTAAAAFCLIGGAIVLAAAAVVARALSDVGAAAAIGGLGLVFAFVGGALAFAGRLPLAEIGATQLIFGSTVLLVAGVLGLVGVGSVGQVFIAGVTAGVLGMISGLLSFLWLTPPAVSAFALTLIVLAVPALPLIATRMAGVPVPELPGTPADLLADQPPPDTTAVFAAVARADEWLTGMVAGACVVASAHLAVLATRADFAATFLAAASAVLLLLRARVFATVRQRAPLVVAGLAGVAMVTVASLSNLDPRDRLVVGFGAALLAAGIAAGAGLAYSRRMPSPYLSRFGDLLDGGLTVALVPFACAIAGLMGFARGFFG